MKKLLVILFVFPLFVFGQQTINDSILVNGTYRSFIIYVPTIYQSSRPVPLIFNLHGRTGSAFTQMFHGDFRYIADTTNFIIVHPQGLLDNTGVTHWNVGQSNVDDIGFINELYQYILLNYNINTDKVYSTGMSNGGIMSYYLACNMSDKIAAIASVTGKMGWFTQLNCNPTHPTPVMEIHGTEDFTVPFDEIIDGLQYWKQYNNCNLIADTTIIPDINTLDSSTVEHIVYNDGDNGVTTELFKIINGGHTWPGSNFNFSNNLINYDINASAEIWEFFSRYDINGLIYHPTLVSEYVSKNKLIHVIDVLGKKTKNLKNQVLFYMYEDGTVEKIINFKD